MHPREFGKFRILQLLPKGGMGTVYLALNTLDNQRVALKLIEPGPDIDRLEIAAAERRGANLQKQICSMDPRITKIRDFGELEGFFFIEMEYVEGQDLSEILRSGPLGIPFAARIGMDLCEVLALTHNFNAVIDGQSYRGIVHGDIKPRNVRITPDGELRVLDFGIAKALSLTRTFTQIQFGSALYSSPERLRTGEVTVASDLWAVAVVLWEVVTARPYFELESGPKLDHAIRTYSSLRPVPDHLPRAFAAILRKALHPDIRNRYMTASAFASDLRAFLEARPTVAESMPASAFVFDADAEATRRTSSSAGADSEEEATRRTAPPSAARPVVGGPRGGVRSRPLISPGVRRFAAGFLLVVFLASAAFIWREVRVWQRGDELARELQAERLTDLDAAFVRYQALQDGNHLPLILHHPRRAVLDKLTSAADRNILEYRESESPTVTQNDWMRSEAALSKALQLDPGDRATRAKLYLVQGHLARLRSRGQFSGKLLNEARTKFEQAHELMSKSPDPYIGLANLYAYYLNDVDRAEDAVEQAQKRNHKKGRREKALLADAYGRRAERLMREASRAAGLPEEKDYLERAASDLNKAQDLYRDIVPYAGSVVSLRRVIQSSDNVGLRLRAIREGA